MNTTSKVILGLAGAVAAGVVIGLLIAPEKGSETRKKLRDTAGDWANKVGDLFAAGKEEYENFKSKASSAADQTIGKTKQNFS